MPDFGDQRQMGCSQADLRRWLTEMFAADVGDFEAGRLQLHRFGVPVTIIAQDLQPRRLGLVALRVVDVSFEYSPADRERVRAWIVNFDRHTQRGGG
jgi:hypothetical protein